MSKTFIEQFIEALEHGITHKAIFLAQFMKDEINELYDYRSPLFWASRYGNEKVAQALREMGAVEVVDKEGMSDELIKILWGEDIDEIDEKRAIELIKDGANIEKKYKFGETALMKASKNGHVEVVEALLSMGAKVDEKDIDGKTAIDYTVNDKIKKMLNDALRKQKVQKFKNKISGFFGRE
jgi:ankyrin repeat protein